MMRCYSTALVLLGCSVLPSHATAMPPVARHVNCGSSGQKLTYEPTCPTGNVFGQHVAADHQTHQWIVTLEQTMKTTGHVEYISWGPTDENGNCPTICEKRSCLQQYKCNGKDKATHVHPHAHFLQQHIPFGRCSSEPICIYVHDESFDSGAAAPYIPNKCFEHKKDLCAMCGPYKVTPTVPHAECHSLSPPKCYEASDCDDDIACTNDSCDHTHVDADDDGCVHEADDDHCSDGFTCTDNVCDPNHKTDNTGCVTTYNNAACDDDYSCTIDICVGNRDPASWGMDELDVDHNNGCGYKEKINACDDGRACTHDECAALPSSTYADKLDSYSTTGCHNEPDTEHCKQYIPHCAVAECVAGHHLYPVGDGCVYSEKDAYEGVPFCTAKYGACAMAMCTGADGVMEYHGGYVDEDGCTVLPQYQADKQCPISHHATALDCGKYTCDLQPTDSTLSPGDGCVLHAGSRFNDECDEKTDCEVGTCLDTGICEYQKDDAKCNTFPECVTATCDPAYGDSSTGCLAVTSDDACHDLNLPHGVDCGKYTCNVDHGCVLSDDDTDCESCEMCKHGHCQDDPDAHPKCCHDDDDCEGDCQTCENNECKNKADETHCGDCHTQTCKSGTCHGSCLCEGVYCHRCFACNPSNGHCELQEDCPCLPSTKCGPCDCKVTEFHGWARDTCDVQGCIHKASPQLRSALKPPSESDQPDCNGTVYDVAVYACGDAPLSCGVVDSHKKLHVQQLASIQTALLEHCASEGAIGSHFCSSGVKVWTMGNSAFTRSPCMPSTEAGDPCPCQDKPGEPTLSAWGHTKVCMPDSGDQTAHVISGESETVCEGNCKSLMCTISLGLDGRCSGRGGSHHCHPQQCSQPAHMQSDVASD
eukprot:jgi/Ulvmu1/1749/UM117_0026.1